MHCLKTKLQIKYYIILFSSHSLKQPFFSLVLFSAHFSSSLSLMPRRFVGDNTLPDPLNQFDDKIKTDIYCLYSEKLIIH